MNKVINTLFFNLKAARESLKLSQLEAANLAGLSQRDISDLETGKKKFVPTEYIQLLNSKGIDLNSIFASRALLKVPHHGRKVESNDPSEKDAIPLVGVEALGGMGNITFRIEEKDIQDEYVVPDFNHISFMLRVKGGSMYPKYSSGDVIACRIIKESKFIQWGKVYVIATKEQGILVKRLKKSDAKNHIVAVSDNPAYDPFEIPMNEIDGIALVVGVIRLE